MTTSGPGAPGGEREALLKVISASWVGTVPEMADAILAAGWTRAAVVAQPTGETDREPQPTDGPDYPADYAAWTARNRATCSCDRGCCERCCTSCKNGEHTNPAPSPQQAATLGDEQIIDELLAARDAALARAEAAEAALVDMVRGAWDYGQQDGEFVALYLLQTGPMHRALSLLTQRGQHVRPKPWQHHPVRVRQKDDRWAWWCLAPGCEALDDGYRTEETARQEADRHRHTSEVIGSALWSGSASHADAEERLQLRAALGAAEARIAAGLAECDRVGRDTWVLAERVRAALSPPTSPEAAP